MSSKSAQDLLTVTLVVTLVAQTVSASRICNFSSLEFGQCVL